MFKELFRDSFTKPSIELFTEVEPTIVKLSIKGPKSYNINDIKKILKKWIQNMMLKMMVMKLK